jgi:hypothetical protein
MRTHFFAVETFYPENAFPETLLEKLFFHYFPYTSTSKVSGSIFGR